jgi:integrase
MARTVQNPKVNTRSPRSRLRSRREPYWTVLSEGCALGYRRGLNGGTWIARFRDETGRQRYEALGAADDARDADNLTVYSFAQAQARAERFFSQKAREAIGNFGASARPLAVADAWTHYQNAYARRNGKSLSRMESSARTYILPELGPVLIDKLTRRRLEEWHTGIANSPARVRIAKGGPQKFRAGRGTPEEDLRRRRSTANRVLTILKAALNHARHEGLIATDDAWQQVKAFRDVDSARLRYLSDDEARKLVGACRADFRPMVIGALLTGCRFGELRSLLTEDFNSDSGTLLIRTSKNGKRRHIALTDEGRTFFAEQCGGKSPNALMFTKANGLGWSASDQQRPIAAAYAAAGILPVTFHGLRHTYASRLAMSGAPLPVIAAQLGHSDTRMVEKHYGHLAPNYVADTVRAAFGRLNIVEPDNVVLLTVKRAV